jgi:hypothetical protein
VGEQEPQDLVAGHQPTGGGTGWVVVDGAGELGVDPVEQIAGDRDGARREQLGGD